MLLLSDEEAEVALEAMRTVRDLDDDSVEWDSPEAKEEYGVLVGLLELRFKQQRDKEF